VSEIDPVVQRLGLQALHVISELEDELLERFPASYAGLYDVGGDGRNFVVLTVGEDPVLEAFVGERVGTVTGGDPRLPSVGFDRAARPMCELLDLRDRIHDEVDALAELGIEFRGVGVNDVVNKVLLLTAPVSDDQRAAIRDRYGPAVQILIARFGRRC
jgi:hypothetical protein